MENVGLVVIIVALILFIFLLSGQWVGLALAAAGIVIIAFMGGFEQIRMVGRLQFNMANTFVLGAVPLFIFMGYTLIHSHLSDLVYQAVTPIVSRIPGGLLHTNVVAGAIFGATCGTSTAGTAAVASVALPQLQKRNYDKKLTYGSVAAGGTMSALIPPSITLIIYGSIVQESVGALFIGGIVPGIIMTILFMMYIASRAIANPHVAPKEEAKATEVLRSMFYILPIGLLALIVLGSIYMGIATPTEAAAVGMVSAVLLSIIYRRWNWTVLRKTIQDSVQLTCMVMLLIVGAQFYGMGISLLGLPAKVTAFFVALPVHRLVVFSFVMVLYIILGMFMEATAILLMTLPITYPLTMSLGFSSVWFGITLVVLVQIGLLTPPFGMDVFITHQISGEKHMGPAIKGAIPFALIMLVVIGLLIVFPQLATWLPSTMMGRQY